jgi:phosphate uptake regulator
MGEPVDQSADTLESLTNERYSAVLSELKSYTLTTDWPGNRVAADLSTIATNLEIVGDRACFIADVVDREGMSATGVVGERLGDIFESGARINEYFVRITFDCELGVHEHLREEEETVHRDLDELFELVTAYDPDMYGNLVSVTRALERAIYYWVDAAELAVSLHTGVAPDHVEL